MAKRSPTHIPITTSTKPSTKPRQRDIPKLSTDELILEWAKQKFKCSAITKVDFEIYNHPDYSDYSDYTPGELALRVYAQISGASTLEVSTLEVFIEYPNPTDLIREILDFEYTLT